MIFNKELKIFKYHFPNYPIFPGALLLDLVKNCILKRTTADCMTSMTFSNPVYPDKELDLIIEDLDNQTIVNIYESEKFCAKLKLVDANMDFVRFIKLKEQIKVIKNYKKFKPDTKSSKEITFLDSWYILKKNGGITAVGEFKFKSHFLDCVNEIYQGIIGTDFLLIEFMSLTVLSVLSTEKEINLEKNFGFARLKNYWSRNNINDGDSLAAIVTCNIVGKGIVWNGCVVKNESIIATIDQGIDMPLK